MRTIYVGDEAREHLRSGAEAVTLAVGRSMGPLGRNVVFDPAPHYPTFPSSTRDGITIARQFAIDGPGASGCKLIREAADKTVQEAGDGTSATCVLAYALYENGLAALKEGRNVVEIRKSIQEDTKKVIEYLDSITIRLSGNMLEQVAIVSANNDSALGKLIADATRQAGSNGIVAVEDSPTNETTIERIEGMQFNQGYLSAAFVNNESRQIVEFQNPLILLLDRPLTSLQGMTPLMNAVAQGTRPLLILAEDVRGEALATLVVNKMKGALAVCAVKLPTNLGHRKDLLLDIAALTGGVACLQELGMDVSALKSEHLGRATKVVVSSSYCRIVGGAGTEEAIEKRKQNITGLLGQTPTSLEAEKLHERLAKLTGGVTVLRLGARSGLELGDLKARCEDSCLATRCALDSGVVPGAGMALASAIEAIPPGVVRSSIIEPALQILDNAGFVARFRPGQPVNALTGEDCDLVAEGILDPVKVVKASLLNAASVAAVMLATDTLIMVDDQR